jgi:hypothetical protein
VVLEQLKREELRKQNKKNEWSILSLLPPGLLLPTPL